MMKKEIMQLEKKVIDMARIIFENNIDCVSLVIVPVFTTFENKKICHKNYGVTIFRNEIKNLKIKKEKGI